MAIAQKRTFILWLSWFTLSALVSNGLANVLVLCQGDDGHLEIEYAKGGDCFSCVEDDGHEIEGAIELQDNHCGECEDYALGADPYTNKDTREKRQAVKLVLAIRSPFLEKRLRDTAPMSFAQLFMPQPGECAIRDVWLTVPLLI